MALLDEFEQKFARQYRWVGASVEPAYGWGIEAQLMCVKRGRPNSCACFVAQAHQAVARLTAPLACAWTHVTCRAWEDERAALQAEIDALRRDAREKAVARRSAAAGLHKQQHEDGGRVGAPLQQLDPTCFAV